MNTVPTQKEGTTKGDIGTAYFCNRPIMSLLELSSFMTRVFVRYLVCYLQVYRLSTFCSDFLCCLI